MVERGSIRVDRAVALEDMYLGPNTRVVAYLDPKLYEARFAWNSERGEESPREDWKPTWKLVRHVGEDFLVIDKPSGISTVASKDHPRGALVPYWLRSHLPREVGAGGLLTTSRLDAGTHGLLIVGRSKEFVRRYNSLIFARKVTKKYTVAVTGWNKPHLGPSLGPSPGDSAPLSGRARAEHPPYRDSASDPRRHLGMWEHWTIEQKEKRRLDSVGRLGEHEPSAPGQLVMSDLRKDDWSHLAVDFSRTRSSIHTVPVQMILERAEPARLDSVTFRPFTQKWVQQQINFSETLHDPIYELDIELITGKTHQIRAQLKAEGLLVVGDWLYGSPYLASKDTFALCCRQLSWICPITGSPHIFRV